MVRSMDFACGKCHTIIHQGFSDGYYVPPIKCEMASCRSRFFEPLRKTAVTVDFQKIKCVAARWLRPESVRVSGG